MSPCITACSTALLPRPILQAAKYIPYETNSVVSPVDVPAAFHLYCTAFNCISEPQAAMLAISADKEVQEAAYSYIEKHELAPLFRDVMEACLVSRPAAPIPFIMDCFQLGPSNAVHDQELGCSVWRRIQLEELYASIVKDHGVIDHESLKEYVTKGSVQLMSDDDVDSWISCLGEAQTGAVSLQQFLQVFVAMTKNVKDEDFRHMIVDLSS